MGPTAAGKTDLAIDLAQRFPVEIISVDSALVYRGMDIGTAKPDAETLKCYPHHLVNILDPTDSYSVGAFRTDALRLMEEISSRGKVPLLVGGTMLYFKGLEQGLADLPSADINIRAKLEREAETYGLAHLHQRLSAIDPISAARIHINDPQRLQRALEVFEITGKSLTELTAVKPNKLPYQIIKVIVSPFDRATLHQRISQRYHNMIDNGFLLEAQRLFNREDCHSDLPAIRAVGYRQAWSHFSGEYDQDIMIDKAIIATRQMAKRQLTWLRSQPDGVWFDSGNGLPLQDITNFIIERCPELVV
jgi:tRNA dimethylallyltransferase